MDDLIEYAGPVLSLYRDADGNPLLRYWANNDDDVNRWLIVPITLEHLNSYLSRKISLRELLLSPEGGAVILLDTNDDQEPTKLTLLQAPEIPSDYLPRDDSFYSFGYRYYSHSSFSSNSLISAEYPELSEFTIGEDGILTHTSSTEAILLQ
ncbi:MAG TPA: DUF6575 domain-containing protein [Candidatus Kapabacteria bacterium]|nr:DUF6575 domain-containing protein [Candidatus Kapabacteria bacterium]